MMSVSGYTVFALLGVAYLAYRLVLRYLTPKPIPGIPHYAPARPFGDIPRMTKYLKESPKRNYIDFFGQMAFDLGPIAQVFLLNKPAIVLSDHQEIEDILLRRKEFDRASLTVGIFSTLIPHALIAQLTDAKFKNHRRFLFTSQSATNLARVVPNMGTSIQHLCRIWDLKRKLMDTKGDAGRKFFKVDHDLELCVLDISGKNTLNENLSGLDDLDAHLHSLADRAGPKGSFTEEDFASPPGDLLGAYDVLFTHLATTMIHPLPGLYSLYLRLLPSWRQSYSLIYGFLTQKVEAARVRETSNDGAESVLDMVVQAERNGVGEKMGTKELCDELLQLLVGGAETTQTTTRWALKFLARNPSVQFKLRKHLLDAGIPDAFEGRLPTFADLSSDKVPYLDAFIWETLRIARTSGASNREAMVDTEILGRFVPKGTMVLFATGHVGLTETVANKEKAEALDPVRSKTSVRGCGYWDEETVGDFRPERYLDENGNFDLKKGPNLVFSAGIRGCFGQKTALLQLKMLISLISMSFYFDTVPKEYDSDDDVLVISRQPRECYINPVPWAEVSVPAGSNL